jgi:hypothetical protein
VNGCPGSGAIAGATVNVWADSSKTTLIASGVTSGNPASVTLNVLVRATYWVEATHTRYATYSGSRAMPFCGNSLALLFPGPASGYHCDSFGRPWKDTLYYTNSRTGFSVTLNYSSADAGWVGTGTLTTIEYLPSDGNCGSLTVPFRAEFDTPSARYGTPIPTYRNLWREYWSTDATAYHCPDGGAPSSGSTACDGNAPCKWAGGGAVVSGDINSSLVYTYTNAVNLAGKPYDTFIYIYGLSDGAMTITISE